jgi:DUF971 family protein
MTRDPAPRSVTLDAKALTLHWSDGDGAILAATLRAACRCAPCQSRRLRGEPVEVGPTLTLVEALPVGHYAVQLRFSDGHDRGIYPWVYLRELAGTATAATRV